MEETMKFKKDHKFDLLDLFSITPKEVTRLFLNQFHGDINYENINVFLESTIVDINTYDLEGHGSYPSPIHAASNSNDIELVKFLISKGADVNLLSEYIYTPLHHAVMNNSIEMVKLLIENGADINVNANDEIDYPISLAIEGRRSNEEIAKVLIEAGADLELFNVESSIINSIIREGSMELIGFVLNHAEKTKPDYYYGFLHKAIRFGWHRKEGNLELIKFILESGYDIHTVYPYDGNPGSAIHLAAESNIEEFKLLLEYGADLNSKTENNRTLLHSSAYGNSLEISKFLIDSGFDVNAQDNYGWTPLHWAAVNDSLELAELLISSGADVNMKTSEGDTPLHITLESYKKTQDIVSLLIKHGADIDVKDETGKTPRELIVEKGYI